VAGVGFALDDVWHRIAGQDVTLWGPMHLVDVGGSAIAAVAMWGLLVEALRARPPGRPLPALVRALQFGMATAILTSFCDFLAEFDFGVPTFRLLFHPFLVAAAATASFVTCRIALGRGGALASALGFIALRGVVYGFVAGVGRTTPVFPLFLAPALLVELLALVVPRRKTLVFGVLAGLAVGSVGLLAERWWVDRVFQFGWPRDLLGQTLAVGIVGGVTGGVLGAVLGRVLATDPFTADRVPRVALALASLAFLATMVGLSGRHTPGGVSADVVLTRVGPGAATAEVTLHPAGVVDHPDWFTVFAFRGGGRRVVGLERIGPGRYRTTGAFPVDGRWYTMLRLQQGGEMAALPISLPADDAIPAPAVPAASRFTRTFERDRSLTQREAVGLDPMIERGAYLVTVVLGAVMLTATALALARIDRRGRAPARGPGAGAGEPPEAQPAAATGVDRPAAIGRIDPDGSG
jgi:hypothetical protein